MIEHLKQHTKSMSNGRVFTTPTNDQMIFGQEMVTMLSVTLIAVILHWTITSFKKDYSLTASRSMRLPCLLSIISFLIMNIVGMIGWNNVFIPITSTTCKTIYPFCLFSYNFGKISMYYLFTFRIELIFKHTAYEISAIWLNIYRLFCFLVPTMLWSIWIYVSWNDIKPHHTDTNNPQYEYCFPQRFKYNNVYLSQNIPACIAVSDLLFSAVPLFLFIFKYYQVTSLYRRAKILTNLNDNGDFYHALSSNLPGFELKHIAIIRKSTMLVIIAIMSTWIYICGQAYILRQLGFYLPFDGVINSLCVACLFQFGDDFYSVTFAKLECCCLCFGPYCNLCSSSCTCCGDFKVQKNKNKTKVSDHFTSTSTSSPNAINMPNNHTGNAIIYHAKIQSHNQANENMNMNMNMNISAHIPILKPKTKTLLIPQHYLNANIGAVTSLEAGTFSTQINIQTPTQRYQDSPEHNLLFSGPQSITEFIPLNLSDESKTNTNTNNTNNINNNNNENSINVTQISQTDSISNNNMTSFKPANKTGSIPVINKYRKPHKIVGF